MEAGILLTPEDELQQYIQSASAAGGFAMTGRLSEMGHGAGIWISPAKVPGLQLMVPWQFVKSVITADSPESSKVFGLLSDLVRPNGVPQKS